jgi:uncharacterized membrane protein
MANRYLVFFLLGVMVSCKQGAAEKHQHEISDSSTETDQPGSKPAWKITGTEPFWNIFIREDTILYSRLNENIDTVYFTNHHFSDQDSLVEFHLTDPQGLEGSLVIRRGASPCSDGMSDRDYAYSATFIYKNETLAGCAELIP